MQILNPISPRKSGRSKRMAWHCIGFFIALLVMSMVPPQKDSPSREYQLKAVFLYNFTQFVEWPEGAFKEQNEPLVIGILGKDPFGTYLDETVRGEKLNDHPLVVQRFDKVEDIKTCHILFVNATEKAVMTEVFAQAAAKHFLTVGDVENFIRQGGMIRFFTDNGKTRIRVNLDATKSAELTISSKLLRVAEIAPQNN